MLQVVFAGLALLWAGWCYFKFYDIDPSRQHLILVAFCLVLGVGIVGRRPMLNVVVGWGGAIALLGLLVAMVIVHTRAFLVIGVMIAAWWSTGDLCLRLIKIAPTGQLAGAMHRLALGITVNSVLLLALGCLGRLTGAFVWGTLVLMLLPALGQAKKIRFGAFWRQQQSHMKDADTLVLAVGIVVGCFLVLMTVRGLAPPLLADDLTYHLGVARIFAREGSSAFLPFFTHFNSPLGAEMLYAGGLVLGSEYAVAGLTNLGFTILLIGAFVLLSRRLAHAEAGWLAALMLLSVPYYLLVAQSGSADLKYLAFVLLAIEAFFHWKDERSNGALWLCAVEAGASLHYRYHGVILIAALAGAIGWTLLVTRRGRFDAFRILSSFIFLAALVGSPWLVRNGIQTGNPIFPSSPASFDGYFGDPELSEIWREYGNPASPWLFGAYGIGMGWLNYLTLPWRVTFLGGVFEGYELTPVFLALAPFGIWFMARNRRARNLSLFAGFYATAWFFQMHQLKFLIPAFAVWALVAAAGALAWAEQLGRWGRGAMVALVLAPTICALKIPLVYSREQLQDAISVALHPRGKDEFLTKHFGVYPMIESMNRELPKDALVFSVDEQNLFYLDRSYILGGPHHQIFVDYRTMVTFRDLLARLRELRVTHLLMRLGPPAPDHLIGAPHAALALLMRAVDFSQLHEIKRHQELVLYKINYDPDLGPYNPTKHADYVKLGDVLMEYGMLERARVQYAKAGLAGASKCAAIQQMDSLARGRFYLNKARELRRTFFLGSALKEFTVARASGVVAEAEQGAQGVAEVYQAGMQFAPHIWARLPSGDWFFRQKTF